MLSVLSKSIQIPEIRKRVVLTLLILAFYRFLAHIPIPTVDLDAMKIIFSDSQFLNFLNLFTGGGLKNLSIVALGIGPYINASIVIQLVIMIYPKLEEMVRDGTVGREKINMYTQLLTLPIALVQGYGIYILLTSQNTSGLNILPNNSPFDILLFVLIVTSGTYLLIWLSEIITEKGIGNGMSIFVFAGILSSIPGGITGVLSIIDFTYFFPVFMFIVVSLAVIAGVVFITDAYRRIEIHYSSQSASIGRAIAASSYIPIKVNQSGVFPIIFAVSLVILPGILGRYLEKLPNPTLSELGLWFSINFQSESFLYNAVYFLLVFMFTYFYTNVSFNPEKIAEDIRKGGGFITGIRPGKNTVDYLRYIINRTTFAGGVFLGVIAILPSVIQSYTGVSSLAIGGTGVLIVVSVILETVKQLESRIVTKEYTMISR